MGHRGLSLRQERGDTPAATAERKERTGPNQANL